ncbi:MAG TPA: hypothetical protein VNF49_01535, partial [Candidatus Binataceae bacterium]|nr:hypothetical protein [Candidatus Binataceae bacterium]
EALKDPKHQQHLAIMLIEHGDLAEAETILAEAVKAGEEVAQLLAVDARLRSGRIDAARELLQAIEQGRITGRLRYPYAVTCADVGLTSGDNELRNLAMAYLRQVPCAGTRLAAEISGLLNALTGDGDSAKRPLWAIFQDFVRHWW